MPDFKQFWDAYGIKKDKKAAEPAWNRLSAKDRRLAVAGITAYREDCQRRGISMMYAQGYLNHHRWEDEIEEEEGRIPRPTPQKIFTQIEEW